MSDVFTNMFGYELPDPSPLVKEIQALENRCARLDNLLGQIIATFSIESNRDHLKETANGKEWLTIADQWIAIYDRIPK